ncbi:TPA: hypothetical protein DCS99_01900 [Candidatus Wolfebacteria bacterium]|nr:hypothetical protein [Candidatus Wolfebacteria bacterium]
MTETTLKRSCRKLIQTIASDPKTAAPFRAALIQKFAGSDDFNNAGDNAELLVAYEGYTVKQVREILRATKRNNQIYRSWKAQRILKRFLAAYKQKSTIGTRLIREFKDAIA